MLPGGVLTPLTSEVMAEYRRPFAEPGEGRRPTLTWPRQIPIDGEPANIAAIVDTYGQWMAHSPELIGQGLASWLTGSAQR